MRMRMRMRMRTHGDEKAKRPGAISITQISDMQAGPQRRRRRERLGRGDVHKRPRVTEKRSRLGNASRRRPARR